MGYCRFFVSASVAALATCLPAVAVGDADSSPQPDPQCPAGSELRGDSPPSDMARGCARKNGTEHGSWTFWWPDGSKWRTGSYLEGRRDGTWTAWWPNGKKMYEATYKRGLIHGRVTAWHENGQKKAEGDYGFNRPNGVWQAWKPDGTKIGQLIFDGGKIRPKSKGNPAVSHYLPRRHHVPQIHGVLKKTNLFKQVGKELSGMGTKRVPSKLEGDKRVAYEEQSKLLSDLGVALTLYASAVDRLDREFKKGTRLGVDDEANFIKSRLKEQVESTKKSLRKLQRTSASAKARDMMAASALRRLD